MPDYPLTPDEFRVQQKESSEQLLLGCSVAGGINGGFADGELVWTLDKLSLRGRGRPLAWPVEEIVEIEVRRGRPSSLSLGEVVIFVPLLTIFTVGIGTIRWLTDRRVGTHLILKTQSDNAWFFLMNTSMADAENALSMFDVP